MGGDRRGRSRSTRRRRCAAKMPGKNEIRVSMPTTFMAHRSSSSGRSSLDPRTPPTSSTHGSVRSKPVASRLSSPPTLSEPIGHFPALTRGWENKEKHMSISNDEVINYLSNLTVIDLVNLTKALEEKWGVKAAPVAAVAAAPAARGRRRCGPGCRGEDRVHRRAQGRRREQDRRHQGRPRGHGPRPQGRQGPLSTAPRRRSRPA